MRAHNVFRFRFSEQDVHMLTLPTLLHRGRTLLLAAMAAFIALPALAQNDPPGRIGRIAWTSGDVYLNNPRTGELGAAPLNRNNFV